MMEFCHHTLCCVVQRFLRQFLSCVFLPNLPENCGYEGDVFIKLEKEKQKIRKLKEEIIYYNSILSVDKSVQRIIDRHQAYIDKYKMYGSEDW